ncbi:MAG: LamG domain-containing protein, partial [Verrucomicrobiales bacterium]|nr:LamG domain-containing protein [Verrucomicrobiales bacterium]
MYKWARVVVLVGVTCLPVDGSGQLLGRWLLGEGGGTVAADTSGNGYDAVVPGGGGWTDDVPPTGFANSWALEFNGLNGHVDTTWEGFGGAVPRTVSFWVKTTATNDHGIVAWGNSTLTGGKWHLRVNSNAANGPVGAIRTEVQGDFHIGTTVINDGEWHHVVSVFPADPPTGTVDDVFHYVDGVLEGIGGVGGGSPLVDTDDFADFMTIGRRRQGAALRAFPGLVDDVRIYDRELSATEVVGLVGATPSTDGMVAYYDFEEGAGEVVNDAGSNGIDGVLIDVVAEPVVVWSDDAPAVAGLTGSVEFNGVDSWMETDFRGIGGTDPRTVAMWIKADPSMAVTDNGILGWGRTATGQKWHVRLN